MHLSDKEAIVLKAEIIAGIDVLIDVSTNFTGESQWHYA